MQNKTDEICEKFNIELVNNHMIYFNDKDDYCVGVLAEDTNYMIRNYPNFNITEEAIKENLDLLKSWI